MGIHTRPSGYPGRLTIHFGVETEVSGSLYRLKSVIRSAIRAALVSEEFHLDAEVSVTLCDNAYIQSINREYRGKDSPTDVLSFPQFERGEPIYAEEDGMDVPLGDIVISLERARSQAEELGNTFYREVAFLAIHSTLHLLGYDHELSPEDEQDMCARQRAIIEGLPFKKKELNA